MKITHTSKQYTSGGDTHEMIEEFDYMLFRQDFQGAERVYFNQDELDEVMEKIMEGEIRIHGNYSILYASSNELLESAPELGCYSTVSDKC